MYRWFICKFWYMRWRKFSNLSRDEWLVPYNKFARDQNLILQKGQNLWWLKLLKFWQTFKKNCDFEFFLVFTARKLWFRTFLIHDSSFYAFTCAACSLQISSHFGQVVFEVRWRNVEKHSFGKTSLKLQVTWNYEIWSYLQSAK